MADQAQQQLEEIFKGQKGSSLKDSQIVPLISQTDWWKQNYAQKYPDATPKQIRATFLSKVAKSDYGNFQYVEDMPATPYKMASQEPPTSSNRPSIKDLPGGSAMQGAAELGHDALSALSALKNVFTGHLVHYNTDALMQDANDKFSGKTKVPVSRGSLSGKETPDKARSDPRAKNEAIDMGFEAGVLDKLGELTSVPGMAIMAASVLGGGEAKLAAKLGPKSAKIALIMGKILASRESRIGFSGGLMKQVLEEYPEARKMFGDNPTPEAARAAAHELIDTFLITQLKPWSKGKAIPKTETPPGEAKPGIGDRIRGKVAEAIAPKGAKGEPPKVADVAEPATKGVTVPEQTLKESVTEQKPRVHSKYPEWKRIESGPDTGKYEKEGSPGVWTGEGKPPDFTPKKKVEPKPVEPTPAAQKEKPVEAAKGLEEKIKQDAETGTTVGKKPTPKPAEKKPTEITLEGGKRIAPKDDLLPKHVVGQLDDVAGEPIKGKVYVATRDVGPLKEGQMFTYRGVDSEGRVNWEEATSKKKGTPFRVTKGEALSDVLKKGYKEEVAPAKAPATAKPPTPSVIGGKAPMKNGLYQDPRGGIYKFAREQDGKFYYKDPTNREVTRDPKFMQAYDEATKAHHGETVADRIKGLSKPEAPPGEAKPKEPAKATTKEKTAFQQVMEEKSGPKETIKGEPPAAGVLEPGKVYVDDKGEKLTFKSEKIPGRLIFEDEDGEEVPVNMTQAKAKEAMGLRPFDESAAGEVKAQAAADDYPGLKKSMWEMEKKFPPRKSAVFAIEPESYPSHWGPQQLAQFADWSLRMTPSGPKMYTNKAAQAILDQTLFTNASGAKTSGMSVEARSLVKGWNEARAKKAGDTIDEMFKQMITAAWQEGGKGGSSDLASGRIAVVRAERGKSLSAIKNTSRHELSHNLFASGRARVAYGLPGSGFTEDRDAIMAISELSKRGYRMTDARDWTDEVLAHLAGGDKIGLSNNQARGLLKKAILYLDQNGGEDVEAITNQLQRSFRKWGGETRREGNVRFFREPAPYNQPLRSTARAGSSSDVQPTENPPDQGAGGAR